MWIAVAILALIPLAGVAYLASLDGSLRVRRSRDIEAPVETVFDAVADLKSWPEWSPWLLHEPETDLVYSEDYRHEGGYYRWDGKHTGAGKLTQVSIEPGRRISQQIEFLRPFKSTSQVNWEFEADGARTRVSWEMQGQMPFLFRFMSERMRPLLERDYDLGLALLGGYVNADSPHPELGFAGRQTLDDFGYWSIPCNGNLRQIEAARQSSIDTLMTAARGRHGLAFTLYHRFDPMAAGYRAEFAIPVIEKTPQSNYIRREFAGGNYFQLTLRGGQEFIPLGWHALQSHCRMHKIKLDPSRPALEIYHDDAAATGSNTNTTTLYLAIR